MRLLFWLLFPLIVIVRFILAIPATAWHARELRKKQPTWTWRKRWHANWLFFLLCMYGLVVSKRGVETG